MVELNYFEDIEIDSEALDIEWLEQGNLALKYAKHLSFLRKEVAQAEELKKTIRSELITQVNENPETCCNKQKPNAADIEAYYRNSERYKDAVTKLIEKQEEADFAELAYNEIAWTRKKALENLVVLHGQQYFAGPKMPRNLRAEVLKHKSETERLNIQKKMDGKIGLAMKRKKSE